MATVESGKQRAVRALFWCGIVGPLLFVVVFLIEGAVRPGYNALRYPVSSLAIGATGWIQAANFFVAGLGIMACAVALRVTLRPLGRAVWGPLMMGIAGLGLFCAGIFTSDPIYGYPESAPLALAQFTARGHLHDSVSIFVFIGIPVAAFVFSRRFFKSGRSAWAVYSLLSGLGMLVAFALAGVGFKQMAGLVGVAGVFQRLSIAIGFVWVSLVAVRSLGAPEAG
jgi:hypothetical membrane protein